MIKAILAVGAVGALALTACSSSKSGGSTAPLASAGSPSTSTASTPSSSAANAAVTVSIAKTSKGNTLVGPNGRSLYTYAPDTATASNCSGGCASTWPPLVGTAQPGAGLEASEFGTVTRSDGSTQITYDKHPLYYYSQDSAAGDINGDGIEGVWHLATTDSAEGGASSSSSTSGGGGY